MWQSYHGDNHSNNKHDHLKHQDWGCKHTYATEERKHNSMHALHADQCMSFSCSCFMITCLQECLVGQVMSPTTDIICPGVWYWFLFVFSFQQCWQEQGLVWWLAPSVLCCHWLVQAMQQATRVGCHISWCFCTAEFKFLMLMAIYIFDCLLDSEKNIENVDDDHISISFLMPCKRSKTSSTL